ncbi:longitudinals lacking protein, isoforms A/B/D/L-like [Thrips palmi]|uniref:Longitudinals lacking protein, isoforms A/B/D/L-like n=1 Tax=Thrips palmi TaxID=161013 RepID=A0A6P8ZY11_THRPL|nr:longitudinals lacking protein, isoforms A/B/D/L-like [Thrips palmi]
MGSKTLLIEITVYAFASSVLLLSGVVWSAGFPAKPAVGLAKFPCERCGSVFSYKGNLLKHLRYTCGKGPQFACPVCPQRNKDKWSLQKHIRNKHPVYSRLEPVILPTIQDPKPKNDLLTF